MQRERDPDRGPPRNCRQAGANHEFAVKRQRCRGDKVRRRSRRIVRSSGSIRSAVARNNTSTREAMPVFFHRSASIFFAERQCIQFGASSFAEAAGSARLRRSSSKKKADQPKQHHPGGNVTAMTQGKRDIAFIGKRDRTGMRHRSRRASRAAQSRPVMSELQSRQSCTPGGEWPCEPFFSAHMAMRPAGFLEPLSVSWG